MLAHTSGFKTNISSLGRELDVRITYYRGNGNLITEDNKLVLTEDNLKILMEEDANNKVRLQIDSDDIYKLEKNNLGELFRTYMKSFDLETTTELDIGSIVIVEIGCKVNGSYEYLNYGHYIVYTKDFNEDKKTYEYQLCDYMIKTMIPFVGEDVFEAGSTKLGVAIRDVCDYCGLPRPTTTGIPNEDEYVYRKTFDGYNLTCRDVLDMMLQASGLSLVMNDETPTIIDFKRNIVDTINEDNLKDKNVKFKEKFGPINSLVFSRANGTDNIEEKDDTSIENNGETQYVVKNNIILEQDNREDFLSALFDQIKGIEYYECDIDLIGLMYLEYLDRFNVEIGENTYDCVCLKNTGSIKNGLTEQIKCEEPQEKTQEYINGGVSDKEASIMMDKINGTIVLKTDSDGKIAKVRLDSSGDEGSLVEISADNIKLEGYTTINGNFKIDNNGNMECANATINGNFLTLNAEDDSYIAFEIIGDDCRIVNNPNGILIDRYNIANRPYIDIRSNYINDDNQSVEIINMGNEISNKIGVSISQSNGIGNIYLSDGNDNETIKMTGSSGNITCVSLTQTSLEKRKKDFEKLSSGLDIIKDIDIYKYRYKDEEDTKKHIGLVIGNDYNYSKDVTNNNNDGVDLYSFVSVCCKAIQEQQEQIEELKREIENLKGGNK